MDSEVVPETHSVVVILEKIYVVVKHHAHKSYQSLLKLVRDLVCSYVLVPYHEYAS